MLSLSLSVVLAAAVAPPVAHGPETEPSASDASARAIPELFTPSTITPSGREFIARCDDTAFARTRYPEGLADQCERLLGLWHREASARKPFPEGPAIPNYGDALRSSQMWPALVSGR